MRRQQTHPNPTNGLSSLRESFWFGRGAMSRVRLRRLIRGHGCDDHADSTAVDGDGRDRYDRRG